VTLEGAPLRTANMPLLMPVDQCIPAQTTVGFLLQLKKVAPASRRWLGGATLPLASPMRWVTPRNIERPSDAKEKNRNFGGRLTTPADFPRHQCSPYSHLHVRRFFWGGEFVHRSRACQTSMSRAKHLAIRNFLITVNPRVSSNCLSLSPLPPCSNPLSLSLSLADMQANYSHAGIQPSMPMRPAHHVVVPMPKHAVDLMLFAQRGGPPLAPPETLAPRATATTHTLKMPSAWERGSIYEERRAARNDTTLAGSVMRTASKWPLRPRPPGNSLDVLAPHPPLPPHPPSMVPSVPFGQRVM
jgi:hypothetical protein